jgi:3-hydroxyisobutyrate dehydrogenase-like beta-hydroxyacid dehydrogenase
VIGFAGLGSMGRPMAENAARAGFQVAGYDPLPERVAAVAAAGVEPAAGLVELASGAELLVASVPGPAELEAVAATAVPAMSPGSLLVNVSTVSPASIRDLADKAARFSVGLVDAPVTGAADGARAGTLTFMVGAEPEALERARPLLEELGGAVHHVGPVGAGSAAKLLTNMLWFVHVAALSDALALAVKAGVELEAFARLVPDSAGASWVAEHDLPNILRGDDDPSFTLALCRKDLGLIVELADRLGYPSPLALEAARRFDEAYKLFGPRAGELAVTRLTEAASGASMRLLPA